MLKYFFAIIGSINFLQHSTASAATNTVVAACKLNTVNGEINGLSGGVYYYPYASEGVQNMTLLYEPWYQQGGYASNPSIVKANDGHDITKIATVATGVTVSNFAFNLAVPGIYEAWETANIYENGVALSFPATNFVLSVSGYLIPNVTGVYNIEVDHVDDYFMMSIGAGISSFGCCSSSSNPVSVNSSSAQYSQGLNSLNKIISFYMVAGYAYPITIFYGNLGGQAVYTVKYTNPNGLSSSDFTGLAFSSFDVVDDNVCTEIYITETILPWTETTTSYTSSTGAVTSVSTVTSMDGIPQHIVTNVIENIIVTEYSPVPHVTSTFYTAYTGSQSSTYSTLTSFIGSSVVSVIYDVDVPYSTISSVSTSFYTKLSLSTYSTLVTTISPAVGAPYVSSILYIDVPDGEKTFTSYTPGTYAYNTTYSTSLTTVIGDNGTPTGSTIYYVYTPYSTSVLTTTSFYSETTSSFSTLVVTITPSTGAPYVSSIVYIDVPDGEKTFTSYTPGTYPYNTTYSTSSTTVIGDNGTPTGSTIYYVYTPYSTSVLTTTSFYSETTSSFSTLVVTITPSTGAPYVSSIVYIDVPDGEKTFTSYTPGTYAYNTTYSTSLTTVIGDNGTPTGSTIYYVYTPYSTYASTTTSFYTETTSSFLTLVTTITPSTGAPYVSSIVHVDVPDVNEVSTTYTKGSVSTITTYSTSYYTLTGNNSQLTFGTIYFVETPSKDFYTTIPWTGAYTTTLSSDYSFTGSDGITTTITYFTVETPEVHTISTTTTYWTGACTSYLSIISSFTGTDDKATVETIIIVKIPTPHQGWNSTTATQPLTAISSTSSPPLTTISSTSASSLTAKAQTSLPLSTTTSLLYFSSSTKYDTATDYYTSTIICSGSQCQNPTSSNILSSAISFTSSEELQHASSRSFSNDEAQYTIPSSSSDVVLTSSPNNSDTFKTSNIPTSAYTNNEPQYTAPSSLSDVIVPSSPNSSETFKTNEIQTNVYTTSDSVFPTTIKYVSSQYSNTQQFTISTQEAINSGSNLKINALVTWFVLLVNFV